MVISFILGIIVGVAVGVLVTVRQYEKHLKTANEQRKQLCEALGKADALTTIQQVKLQGLQLENNQLKVRLERAVVPVGDRDTFPA